jgi:hypothetical protein
MQMSSEEYDSILQTRAENLQTREQHDSMYYLIMKEISDTMRAESKLTVKHNGESLTHLRIIIESYVSTLMQRIKQLSHGKSIYADVLEAHKIQSLSKEIEVLLLTELEKGDIGFPAMFSIASFIREQLKEEKVDFPALKAYPTVEDARKRLDKLAKTSTFPYPPTADNIAKTGGDRAKAISQKHKSITPKHKNDEAINDMTKKFTLITQGEHSFYNEAKNVLKKYY